VVAFWGARCHGFWWHFGSQLARCDSRATSFEKTAGIPLDLVGQYYKVVGHDVKSRVTEIALPGSERASARAAVARHSATVNRIICRGTHKGAWNSRQRKIQLQIAASKRSRNNKQCRIHWIIKRSTLHQTMHGMYFLFFLVLIKSPIVYSAPVFTHKLLFMNRLLVKLNHHYTS
jgi:hypothetical protein